MKASRRGGGGQWASSRQSRSNGRKKRVTESLYADSDELKQIFEILTRIWTICIIDENFEECGGMWWQVLRCAKRIGGRVTSVDGAIPHKDSRNLSAKVYAKYTRCGCSSSFLRDVVR